MTYTKVGPFVDGGPPYLSAADLNTMENGIVAAQQVFNVRDPQFAGGAKGDDSTDDTPAIQAAITAAITAGGGTVYFPMPNLGKTYRYEQILIDAATAPNRVMNLALVGDPGISYLRPFRDRTDASVIITNSAASGADTANIEFVTLRNLMFTNGYYNGPQTSATNRIGVSISNAQNILFDNVTIQGFWQQGLLLRSVEDSKFINFNIFWCGHATSDTDYAYGLEIGTYVTTGGVDNGASNALEFTNFHFETCPLEIHVIVSAVAPISFVNGKLERRPDSNDPDATTKNPIWFEDAYQVTFTNVHFFEDLAFTKYIISQVAADSTYMTSSNTRRHIKFLNCTFGSAYGGAAMSRWATGNYLTFDDCTFGRVDGTSSGGVFALGNGSKLTNCEITLATTAIGVFGITGPYVVIRDVLVQNASTTTSTGDLFTFAGAYDGVIVDGLNLNGFFSSLISGSSPSYLGNGIFSRPQIGSTRQAVTGSSTFLAEKVNLNPAAATNFVGANFPHGHNGKRLVLQALNGFSTLVHDAAALYLKGAANRTLTGGTTVHLYNDQGVWREI